MAQAKDCHTLTSYYIKRFKEKYSQEPMVNRHSARWGFDSVLSSMGMAEAKELIDYYFTTPGSRRHELDWFLWNYEKLQVASRETKKDKSHVDKLLEESRLRAERWLNSGKQSIANPKRGIEE